MLFCQKIGTRSDHLPTTDELLDGVIKYRTAVEADRQQWKSSQKQHHEEVVANLLAKGAEAFIDFGRLNDHQMRDEPRCQPLIEQAKQLIAEREANTKARAAARETAKKEAEAKAKVECEAWIAEHGSDHLKRLVAEGIECNRLYYTERLLHDYPGWRYYKYVPGDYSDPENPPLEAINLLNDARKVCPKAKLVFWEANEEDCEWSGYAAVAKYIDDTEIVFGGPEESN